MFERVINFLTEPRIDLNPEQGKKLALGSKLSAIITVIATTILASATLSLWASGYILLASLPLIPAVILGAATYDLYHISENVSAMVKANKLIGYTFDDFENKVTAGTTVLTKLIVEIVKENVKSEQAAKAKAKARKPR